MVIDPEDDSAPTTGEVEAPPAPAPIKERSAMLLILGSAARLVTGKMFKLMKEETRIGRSASCEVVMPDDGISRTHARLKRTPAGAYELEDLGSRNGTYVNGERISKMILTPGDKIQVGSTTVLMFAVHDAIEAQFQKKMYEAATHDALTGLYNRRFLLDALAKELPYCLRHGTPLSLLMIDLDHFKAINDTHGHPAGDFVLCRMADGLLKATRAEDLVARYGGEEFAVLLREIDAAGAAICAERCRALIEKARYEVKSKPIKVTLSIGVATLADKSFTSVDALMAAADEALYAAKAGGRNCVVAYSAAD
jgi:two-component system cell cycle response regulator